MRESDIRHEVGRFWVGDTRDSYTVYVAGITHSTPDSSYEHNDDGLSIAIARCDYLARRSNDDANLKTKGSVRMINIPSDTLKEAFKRVSPAVDRKSIIKAFHSVRLVIAGDKFEMTAGGPEGQASFRAALDEQFDKGVDVCVEADRIAPVLGVSDDEVVLSLQKNGRLKIVSGTYSVAVPTLPASAFPVMKVEGDVIADTTVEGLADIVGRVVFAANPKHTSEACRGVWIESDGNQLAAMATNVNVLATAQVQLACAPFSMLLSMTAAELLVSLDPKHIALTKSHFSATAGGTELILKPMSYKPINWRKALPDLKNSVTFDSKSLRAAVSMHRHYGDKIGAVRFKSEGTECSLEIVNPDNDALIELDAVHSDDLTEFNYVFSGHQLSQILAGAPDNNVTFFWNAENPRAFLVQNGNWRGVISPLIV